MPGEIQNRESLGSDGKRGKSTCCWERWHSRSVGRETALDLEDKRGHCSQGRDGGQALSQGNRVLEAE